jgi:RNA polymerase sigma-70 factor, ECF subfamily
MTALSLPRPTTDLAESELIHLAQQGDHAAFERLFSRYERDVRACALAFLPDRDDAADAVQDTFTKAFLALTTGQYRHAGVFVAWLRRIAANVCKDELRHRKLVQWQPWEQYISVFHPSQVGNDRTEVAGLHWETSKHVQETLALLKPHYRTALLLNDVHDLSYEEIGETLGITRHAVKSLVYRARIEFERHWATVSGDTVEPTGRRTRPGRFRSYVYERGERRYLGRFDTPAAAAAATQAWRAQQAVPA